MRRLWLPLLIIVWSLQIAIASASLNLPQKTKLSVTDAGPGEVFGTSVAVDGDTAVVGALGAQLPGNPNPLQGAVFVYTRDNTGAWTLQTPLVASDGAAMDFFGYSVALQGDTLLVGSPQSGGLASAHQGAVYVFTRTNGTWTQTAKLTSGLDAATNDEFGFHVALDGDTAAVGAPSHLGGNGAVWTFTRTGATWTIGPKLLANDPDTAVFFGYRVAVSGDTVLIGSPATLDSGAISRGAAFVHTRGNGTWPRQTKLMAPASENIDLFGIGVSLQQNTALIGASCQSTGCAGAAFVYTRTGTTWSRQATIRPANNVPGDQFGASVSLASPFALIGSPAGPTGDQTTATGEVHLFSKSGSIWTEQAVVHASDGVAGDQFGGNVALSRSVGIELTAFVGAAQNNTPHGSVYVFGNLPPTLQPISNKTTPEDTTLRVPFVVGDLESPLDSLALQASSSDPVVAGLTFEGTGTNRTLVIALAPNQSGQATIDLSVSDDNFTAEQSFNLTVTPVDDPPTISAIPDQTTPAGTPTAAIPFTIDDIDTPVDALVVSVVASNPDLVPPAGVHVSGTGASRSLTITPTAFAHGTSTLTVHLDDATSSVSRTFTLTVPDPARTYYLAEGSTGAFFDTDLLLANPNNMAVPITISYFKEGGSRILDNRTLAPLSRLTIHVDEMAGMEATSFSTAVASPTGLPLIVERTMRWDSSGYGAHGEKATEGAATQWYFAEGSQGFFSTFLLLVNPQTTANTAHITYFREGDVPLVRSVPLPAESRVTVYAGADAELQNRSFGALVAFDQPGTAERAMYFGTDPLWSGGSDSVGVTTPSTTWYLAEGATGSFFNTFVLLANPGTVDATTTLTYLPDTGMPVVKQRVVPAGQRVTINIATEDSSLASAAVSTRVESTQPILVERSQYWPAPGWYESHNSFGLTSLATRWGLAEGRVGGPSAYQTYILLANPGSQPADVTVRFLRPSGAPLVKTFTVQPARRFNIAVTGGGGGDVPELDEAEFGAVIESSQPIAVERAMYSNANGVVWAAGTNATATPLP